MGKPTRDLEGKTFDLLTVVERALTLPIANGGDFNDK